MQYDPKKHHRRSIRLHGYDYTRPGAYFITICVQAHECILGHIANGEMHLNDLGEIVRDEWLRAGTVRNEIVLDEFVIMPNHVHGIVFIRESGFDPVGATRRVAPTWVIPTSANGPMSGSIGAIMGQFKSIATKRINAIRGLPGVSVWQRDFNDHIIRNDGELNRIRHYITQNPARWKWDSKNPKRISP